MAYVFTAFFKLLFCARYSKQQLAGHSRCACNHQFSMLGSRAAQMQCCSTKTFPAVQVCRTSSQGEIKHLLSPKLNRWAAAVNGCRGCPWLHAAQQRRLGLYHVRNVAACSVSATRCCALLSRPTAVAGCSYLAAAVASSCGRTHSGSAASDAVLCRLWPWSTWILPAPPLSWG